MQNPPASDWNLEYKFHWQGKGSNQFWFTLLGGYTVTKCEWSWPITWFLHAHFHELTTATKLTNGDTRSVKIMAKCSWRLVFSSFSNIHETRPTNLATCKQAFTVSLWVILTKIIFCPFFAQDLIPGATFIGVGFDGRGDYSPDSSKMDLVQRACKRTQRWVIIYII